MTTPTTTPGAHVPADRPAAGDTPHRRRRTLVGAAVIVQVLLVGVAVWSPLSARLTGDEVRLRVAPVDPIDPFRGAYVQLGYPDLPGQPRLDPDDTTGSTEPEVEEGDRERGEVWVTLTREGDVWVGGAVTRTRPADGIFLRCDDSDWRLSCGIESWFLPQAEASALEDALRDGTAVATLRVDGRGNAALIDVEVDARAT